MYNAREVIRAYQSDIELQMWLNQYQEIIDFTTTPYIVMKGSKIEAITTAVKNSPIPTLQREFGAFKRKFISKKHFLYALNMRRRIAEYVKRKHPDCYDPQYKHRVSDCHNAPIEIVDTTVFIEDRAAPVMFNKKIVCTLCKRSIKGSHFLPTQIL